MGLNRQRHFFIEIEHKRPCLKSPDDCNELKEDVETDGGVRPSFKLS